MDIDLDALRKRYTEDQVPPCRVCGGELSIQAMGGGAATVYGCSTSSQGSVREDYEYKDEIKNMWDHYGHSKWTQYRSGDSRVLDLIDAYIKLRDSAVGSCGWYDSGNLGDTAPPDEPCADCGYLRDEHRV